MDHIHLEKGVVSALPTPADTPYRTPPRSRSRSRSRQLRRDGSGSSLVSSSLTPLPPHGDLSPEKGQAAKNSANDESISPLDPRRFTPTLHASLVSEILSLRREVESKAEEIHLLEASLHTTRNENESLQETIASTSKGTRSLRRQMQLLEGGSVSALSELTRERDEALNDAADLRKRLELSQQKSRSQDESAQRAQMLWDRDRGTWETEKRVLETKVHIVEGRLKAVLNEVANSQMVNGQILHHDANHHQSPKKMHLRKGSAASMRSIGPIGRRRDSEVSLGTLDGNLHEHRLSALTLLNGHSTSLADELAINEEEEEEEQGYRNGAHEDQALADELPEERPISVQLRSMDLKARKILGLAPDDQLTLVSVNEQQGRKVERSMRTDVVSNIQALYKVQYADAAVQCSPPASPKLSPTGDSPKVIRDDDNTVFSQPHQDLETAAEPTNTSDSPFTPPRASSSMSSASCQTSSQLPSPPWTPLSPQNPSMEGSSASPSFEVKMVSTATQTDVVNGLEGPDASDVPVNPFQGLSIPIIAIHPPASRPTTPISSVVLPPHTKNASCQVNSQDLARYTSSSMQTEEIRVDARTAQLPKELLSSSKPFKPTDNTLPRKSSALQHANPLPNSSRRRLQQPGLVALASPQRRVRGPVGESAMHSPTSELEGPITRTQAESLTSASGSSPSLFATENPMKDEIGELEQNQFDEDDIFSRPMAKFTLKAGKLVAKEDSGSAYQETFDELDAVRNEPGRSPGEKASTEMSGMLLRHEHPSNVSAARPLDRKPRTLRSTSSKPFDIRKAALVSSGAAAHQSSGDRNPIGVANPPPFPVPTRHSSRKLPISASEGAQSPTPTGRSPRKREGKTRKPAVRKARSATSVARPSALDHHPQRSPSPPVLSSPYHAAKPPGLLLPPMPSTDAAAADGLAFVTSSRWQGANQQQSHSRTDSASTVLQQTSVVDAIAQTMVGEWMYKYVRRRKSFGVPEPKSQEWDLARNGDEMSANVTNTGVRHKRWVWLAPYERAVLWSSKQPTSGSALMGKSGRKLDIQSVLDVRDDNPPPRGSGPGPHLNRSILILTPERALKFTATSQERHYVWLTALSFLSHSPLGIGELTSIPHIPQQECSAPVPPGASLRRNPIRDSIRVAKGRDPRGRWAGQRSFTTDGVIPPYGAEREVLYQPSEAAYEANSDAADPPTVPRYSANTRRRSNTAPRVPAPSFRNFSNHSTTQSPPSTYSMTTATASDVCTPPIYNGHNGWQTVKNSFSRRGSEVSSVVANPGYFDHVTPIMRMEAFIGEDGGQRVRGSYRTRKGRKKEMGYWAVDEEVAFPGEDLPEEVVHRSGSPTVQGRYPGSHNDEGFLMNEEDHKVKKHVIPDDLASDGLAGLAGGHFRGF